MSEFWTIYENEIHERFELQNTVCNSESHRELINFEILVGRMFLRPRPPTMIVEKRVPDAKHNEARTEEKYFCQKCNEEFKTKFAHMTEKHPNDCPYCPAIYTVIWNLRRHIKKQHRTLNTDATKEKYCQKCNEEYTTKFAHMIEKHPNDCPYCPETYTENSNLRRHIKNQHPTLFDDYVEDRKMEQEANSNNRENVCQKCNKEFKSTFTHMMEKHPNDCPYCPVEFTAPPRRLGAPNLRRHIREKHETLYNEYLSARGKIWTEHQAAENSNKFTKLFSCEICKTRYTRPQDVERHIQEVHEYKRYTCKFCKYQSPRAYRVRMHEQKIHLNLPN